MKSKEQIKEDITKKLNKFNSSIEKDPTLQNVFNKYKKHMEFFRTKAYQNTDAAKEYKKAWELHTNLNAHTDWLSFNLKKYQSVVFLVSGLLLAMVSLGLGFVAGAVVLPALAMACLLAQGILLCASFAVVIMAYQAPSANEYAAKTLYNNKNSNSRNCERLTTADVDDMLQNLVSNRPGN